MAINNENTRQINEENKLKEVITERGLAEAIADGLQSGRSEGKTDEEIKTELKETLTDEQKEYIDTHKVDLNGDDLTAYPKPRDSCPYCYGRGYEGWFKDGKVKICRWMTNNFARIHDEDRLLTLGKLNNILSLHKPPWIEKPLSKKKRHRIGVALRKQLKEQGGQI